MTRRRDFLKNTGALALAGLAFQNVNARSFFSPSAHLDKIGVQLFSIPKLLEKDFAGTMKMVASVGFKEVELFGPYPFSTDEAKQRWKAIEPQVGFSGSGYFGLTIKEVKKILDDNGLATPSMHTDLSTLKNKMGEMAEAAHALGHNYVILPSYETQPTLDAYQRLADQFNEIGAHAKKLGIRFAFHNHGNGLHEIEGKKVPLDLLIEKTDPELVFLQMDIYWTQAGGTSPAALLDKYPGRYRLIHLKDMKKDVRFSGDGGDPKQWIELWPYMADAGSGVLDLKNIITHAKKSGVEHYILERDLVPDPEIALPKSYKYLAGLDIG
ncbi:MAG: sugar phosphate isomerase/epimerase [Bacteroidetes bacterium]|nr:sugar phosphate isomerase/epimerase [Bacteroidota bacterium]